MPDSLPKLFRLMAGLMLGALLPYGLASGAEALRRVEVIGVTGDAQANIRASLSLTRLPKAARAELSEARLAYLLRRAPDEARRALEPYGYYDARVESDVQRSADGVVVVLTVTPGDAVRVTSSDISMDGAGGEDAPVASVIAKFEPRVGERLDHRQYEASKLAVQRRLLERGYFDAELVEHRIEVTRLAREARLKVRWDSGRRYRFGQVLFEGSQINRDLLEKTIPFEPGDPYRQREMLELHQRLTNLDYFGYIDVRPDTEAAVDDAVPVRVAVTPGKRSVYTAGLSYGTDAGGGVQLGLERRWVNDRGHKFGAQIDYAQRRQSLATTYRIPAFAWAEGWYSIGANRRDEESDSVRSRITEVVAQRTGRVRGWDLAVAFNVRNEAFEIGEQPRDAPESVLLGERRLVYPSISAERKVMDDALFPRRGFLLRGEFKLGAGAIGSETDFGQMQLDAKFVRGVGESNRLLVRGQYGRTFTDEFAELPPSLRFFAGGDRSIRGYGYQEVGPRLGDEVIGGKHLLTASVEFERMFTRQWGAAVFVDGGDAFSERDSFEMRTGVGAGVRWRSPVGLVRLDLAHGLDEADNAIQLHINIGPDL
jgi:translocation and assembly module TamA